MTAPEDHRLPRNVEPELYDITLSPDIDGGTFAGEEQIALVIREPVTRLSLNALELAIEQAELVAEDGTCLQGSVHLDVEAERAEIDLDGTALPGRWTLRLVFSGALKETLRGFYLSTFHDRHGHTQKIATTQFEATDARRAFPCWDEPDRKAAFRITLIVDDGLLAVSNAPIAAEVDAGNGKRRVTFSDTMKMSTYLVAFVVGPLVATAPVDVDGTPVRVVCVPGKEHLGSFASKVAAHSLRFCSAYFGIPYAGAKLDLIALPDFAMGAMENLGAVTFRESVLLVDERTASGAEMMRVADVIAHEIAHMWFGDLATMKWWNGIWLNEAFATFVELLCVDAYEPTWKRWITFATDRSPAMTIDSLSATRPVEFPVTRPAEAEGMFDPLTYQKGAAVLRMLEQYVGRDDFRTGISRYVGDNAYGNAETSDLWLALESATAEPVRQVMDSWILQGGYPLISVEADGRGVVLTQRRFRLGSGASKSPDDAELWQVPVLVRASIDGVVDHYRILLTDKSGQFDFGGRVDWAVVNEGGWGFYRVQYSEPLFAALLSRIATLSPQERHMVVSDVWAAVESGTAGVTRFLSVASELAAMEEDPSVWSAIVGGLTSLDRVVEPLEQPALRSFVRSLLHPVFARLGWSAAQNEGERTRTLRADIITTLGILAADEGVRARAREIHASYLTDHTAVDPDVAGAVINVVATAGDAAEYATFLRRWRTASTPQEELRYLYALANFREPGLIERTIELTFAEVRPQSAPFVIRRLLENPAAGPLAWEAVKAHWPAVLERFPSNLHDRMLEGVVTLSTAGRAADVHAFLGTHPVPAKARGVHQILERLDVAVALRQRLHEGIEQLRAGLSAI